MKLKIKNLFAGFSRCRRKFGHQLFERIVLRR